MFTQLAGQVLKHTPADLKCAQRAWKVTLVGEGADDAGGVFDESIAQMCEVHVIHVVIVAVSQCTCIWYIAYCFFIHFFIVQCAQTTNYI